MTVEAKSTGTVKKLIHSIEKNLKMTGGIPVFALILKMTLLNILTYTEV